MRRWCIFKYHLQFFLCIFITRACYLLYVYFLLCVNLWSFQSSSFCTLVHLRICLFVFSFSIPLWPALVFPAEPEEKQKEILNNTIPEGKDSGDLLVFTLLSACLCLCHCWSIIYVYWVVIDDNERSLVFSEVRGWLSRPVVGSDDPPWQRGASQCGGVSVCLQGGSGLWRPGDSGLWNEGNTTENCVISHFRDTEDTQRDTFTTDMKMNPRNKHYLNL